MFDVVTLGETMLRLTPPGLERLERTRTLDVHSGGSESNTAVALSRLGSRVCWLSRLPDNPLADLVCGEIARFGVDIRYVVRAQGERIGTYYYEPARAPRNSRVFYDRADSASARMRPEDLPAAPFQHGISRLFHTTGITVAISETARATARAAVDRARDASMRICFDVNHRQTLWSPTEARAHYDEWLALSDLVFVAERDVALLWPELSTAVDLHRRCPGATLVITRGAEGSIAVTPENREFRQAAFEATEVERLGRGDAFSGGFIHQWLATDGDVGEALRWGAAVAALKFAMPGDMALVTPDEVRSVIEGGGQTQVQR